MLKNRLFGTEWFIFIAAALMMLMRIVYLHFFDAVNETKFEPFSFQEHFSDQLHFYLIALFYIALQMRFCVDYTYKKASRSRKDISFFYLSALAFLSVKIFYPDQYYIDMLVPIFYIVYVGCSEALTKKNNAKLLFWASIMVLVGSLNESKAAALRLLLVIPILYYLQHPKAALKLNISPRMLAVLVLIVAITVYFVAVRSGSQISLANASVLISLAVDIVSQRFNIIDGAIATSGGFAIDIAYVSFLKNHFVLLPGIDPSGQTLANFVACEVDLNCSGEHAGALGLPMMLKLLPIHYAITSFVITTFAYHMTKILLSSLGLGIHWFVAFDGVFLLTIFNLFVSGSFDVCISEFIVLSLSISGFAILYLFFNQFVFRMRHAHSV